MKFLIVACAAIACALANPANYAYSAYAPLGYAYNQLAYSPYSAVPYAYAAHVAAPIAVGVKSQYYSDVAGHVSYGHSEPGQSQVAVQDPAGNKAGSFSYVNPAGKVVVTNYIADALGYRVTSNDLPVAQHDQPAPVQDTPEVAAAKSEFFAQYEAVKSRSRRTIVAPVAYSAAPVAYSTASYTYHPAASYAYSASPYAYSAVPSVYSPYSAYPYSYTYSK